MNVTTEIIYVEAVEARRRRGVHEALLRDVVSVSVAETDAARAPVAAIADLAGDSVFVALRASEGRLYRDAVAADADGEQAILAADALRHVLLADGLVCREGRPRKDPKVVEDPIRVHGDRIGRIRAVAQEWADDELLLVDGRLHRRVRSPAVLRREPDGGTRAAALWTLDGVPHRSWLRVVDEAAWAPCAARLDADADPAAVARLALQVDRRPSGLVAQAVVEAIASRPGGGSGFPDVFAAARDCVLADVPDVDPYLDQGPGDGKSLTLRIPRTEFWTLSGSSDSRVHDPRGMPGISVQPVSVPTGDPNALRDAARHPLAGFPSTFHDGQGFLAGSVVLSSLHLNSYRVGTPSMLAAPAVALDLYADAVKLGCKGEGAGDANAFGTAVRRPGAVVSPTSSREASEAVVAEYAARRIVDFGAAGRLYRTAEPVLRVDLEDDGLHLSVSHSWSTTAAGRPGRHGSPPFLFRLDATAEAVAFGDSLRLPWKERCEEPEVVDPTLLSEDFTGWNLKAGLTVLLTDLGPLLRHASPKGLEAAARVVGFLDLWGRDAPAARAVEGARFDARDADLVVEMLEDPIFLGTVDGGLLENVRAWSRRHDWTFAPSGVPASGDDVDAIEAMAFR